MHIHSLHLYPVKSCRGLAVSQADVTARGFRHDRRWIVADRNQNYKFITQRSHPCLAEITVAVDEQGQLTLSSAGVDALTIASPQDGTDVTIPMWKEAAPALDAGDEAARWLKQIIPDDAVDPRLCYQADEHFRPVDPDYGVANDPLSFADGSPILIINQASVDELNSRLPQPVPADRFRANIVLNGLAPFAEDYITSLQIGGIVFDLVNPCDRCKIVTLDQQTGIQDAPENNPLKALGDYRRGNKGKIYFGIDAIPRGTGPIAVGGTVEIVSQTDIAHHLNDNA